MTPASAPSSTSLPQIQSPEKLESESPPIVPPLLPSKLETVTWKPPVLHFAHAPLDPTEWKPDSTKVSTGSSAAFDFLSQFYSTPSILAARPSRIWTKGSDDVARPANMSVSAPTADGSNSSSPNQSSFLGTPDQVAAAACPSIYSTSMAAARGGEDALDSWPVKVPSIVVTSECAGLDAEFPRLIGQGNGILGGLKESEGTLKKLLLTEGTKL